MMTRINLLPQDYRKKTATPLRSCSHGRVDHARAAARVRLDLAPLRGAREGRGRPRQLESQLQAKAPMLAYAGAHKAADADFENRPVDDQGDRVLARPVDEEARRALRHRDERRRGLAVPHLAELARREARLAAIRPREERV